MDNTIQMDKGTLHDTTVSVVDGDPGGDIEEVPNDNREMEAISSDKEVMRKVARALIRLELDLACTSEKLVNMNLFMMHVAAREGDFEAFASEKEGTLDSSFVKALEFDTLSGLFYSEITEMDKFVRLLQKEANDASEIISSLDLGEGYMGIEEKWRDIEKSIKQSQEQVSELMMQSGKFREILSKFNGEETSIEEKEVAILESCDSLGTSANFKMETSEQQRHILRMLEKSLARELDLENKLTECTQALDEMKLRQRSSKREVLSMEEETAAIFARFLEADSASTVLMGISKDLMGQLQSRQLIINSATRRENELNTRLQNSLQSVERLEKEEVDLRKLAERNRLEALALQEKVNSLEEKLKDSESMLLSQNASLDSNNEKLKELEEKVVIAEIRAEKAEDECRLLAETNKGLTEEIDHLKGSSIPREKLKELEEKVVIAEIRAEKAEDECRLLAESNKGLTEEIDHLKGSCIPREKLKELEEKVVIAEIRAEKAEDECRLLAETNKGLTEEIDHLKGSCIPRENVESLEKQLKETNVQLQQAMAYVDASNEQQSMLYTSINDMNALIENLKSKVSKADARADSAEDKLIILSESNAELNEELNFLRNKLECLETSLQRAEETKLATVKDIDIQTQMITDLIMQLAIERERLHKQMAFLMKENRALVDKLHVANRVASDFVRRDGEKNEEIPSSKCRVDSVDSGKGDNGVFGTTEVAKSSITKEGLDGEYKPELEDTKSKLETVRSIDPGRLNIKYVLSAVFAALIAVLAACFFWPENCPF